MSHPSDNMYSLDSDSDSGEHARQLLPTDGYFTQSGSNATPRVPNILVADPTYERRQQRERDAKARKEQEAEEEARSDWPAAQRSSNPPDQASASLPSPLRYHPSTAYPSSSAAATATSRTPLLSARYSTPSPSVYSEAPPAYSPSSSNSSSNPPHRPSSATTHVPGTYESVSITMGNLADEQQRLLPPQEPQSMGLPPSDEPSPRRWVRRARSRLAPLLGCRAVVAAFIILIVVLAVTIRPNTKADMDPDMDNDFHSCTGQSYRFKNRTIPLNFASSRSISFLAKQMEQSGTASLDFIGQINVRRLDDDKGARMVLEIVANDPTIQLPMEVDDVMQVISLNIPRKHDYPKKGLRPCVQVRGTLFVPEDADIGSLSISGPHLGIRLFDDLRIHVAGSTTLRSVSGNIRSGIDESALAGATGFVPARDSYVLDTRVIEVSSTSGKIDGNWPLYDGLHIKTVSGNVKVSVTPNVELADKPKPAALSIRTVSGSISVSEPIDDVARIPKRDYITEVVTRSGTIHGNLAFTSHISASSISGAMSLELLPVLNGGNTSPRNPASLDTTSVSGVTDVQVLEPLRFDEHGRIMTAVAAASAEVLDSVSSSHKTINARIELRYPQAWEGLFYAESISGALSARGKDLLITRQPGSIPTLNKMEARKGAGKQASTLHASTTSGSIDALIGDE